MKNPPSLVAWGIYGAEIFELCIDEKGCFSNTVPFPSLGELADAAIPLSPFGHRVGEVQLHAKCIGDFLDEVHGLRINV